MPEPFLPLGRCRRRLRRSNYDASDEFAAVPLDESADRCFLGPLARLLDGLGVPTPSFEVSPEPFDALADLFDGRIGESGVSTAGFGFLANGFGFPAGGSVFGSTETVGVASVCGGPALTCASSPGLAATVTRCASTRAGSLTCGLTSSCRSTSSWGSTPSWGSTSSGTTASGPARNR